MRNKMLGGFSTDSTVDITLVRTPGQQLEAEDAKPKEFLAEARLDVEALNVAFGVKR